MNCNICDNVFEADGPNEPVDCIYCHYTACNACWETYLLSQLHPRCMNTECSKIYTRRVLAQKFNHAFLNKHLRKVQEEVLFDMERARLPELMEQAAQIQRERNMRAEIRAVNAKLCTKARRDERDAAIVEIERRYGVGDNATTVSAATTTTVSRANRTKNLHLFPCPQNKCRGYIGEYWNCQLCESVVCHQCHVILSPESRHVCNANDVKTIKSIKHESKPCPTCKVPIYHNGGCDSMWCSQCHTPFDWRTGRITERTSNPHYYEYMRQMGRPIPREPLDVAAATAAAAAAAAVPDHPCNPTQIFDIIYQTRINNMLNRMGLNCKTKFPELIQDISQIVIHISDNELPHNNLENMEEEHTQIRLKYLLGDICEKTFKERIYVFHRTTERKQEFHDIFMLLRDTVADILLRFYELLERADIQAIITCPLFYEIENIVTYFNENLKLIYETYDIKICKYVFLYYSKNNTAQNLCIKYTTASEYLNRCYYHSIGRGYDFELRYYDRDYYQMINPHHQKLQKEYIKHNGADHINFTKGIYHCNTMNNLYIYADIAVDNAAAVNM